MPKSIFIASVVGARRSTNESKFSVVLTVNEMAGDKQQSVMTAQSAALFDSDVAAESAGLRAVQHHASTGLLPNLQVPF
jgi:hypothetical protein